MLEQECVCALGAAGAANCAAGMAMSCALAVSGSWYTRTNLASRWASGGNGA